MRIRKRRAIVERKAHSVCSRGNRDDAIGRAFARTVADDEEIVVVVDQFVRGGKPFAERLAHRANQRLIFRLEFVDELLECLFGISGRSRSGLRGCLHAVSPPRNLLPRYRDATDSTPGKADLLAAESAGGRPNLRGSLAQGVRMPIYRQRSTGFAMYLRTVKHSPIRLRSFGRPSPTDASAPRFRGKMHESRSSR